MVVEQPFERAADLGAPLSAVFANLPMADSWKFETLDVQRDVATGGLALLP